MKIYNVMSRQKEDFITIDPDEVKLYVCGPTVYSDAHVGHAMSSIVFDIIRRYLEFKGYTVKHVMNYTDVDDKIIDRANQQGVDPIGLAEHYIDAYTEHLADLNVLPATVYPRATQTMQEMFDFITGLIDKGYAYPADDGSVYFRVEKDDDYGRLSGRKLKDMQAGARLEVNDLKAHPMDFALWKAAKPGEPYWDSPWGQGRPGWHIECSAMVAKHLGPEIDIHGGGNDLLFPHHENEIAQSECYHGHNMARFWVHNGMLQLSGEKMSKSIGNLVTINEFLADNDPDIFRLIVLGGSYRAPLAFNDDVIAQANSQHKRLVGALRPVNAPAAANDNAGNEITTLAENVRAGFIAAMDDDFNTPQAMTHLFALVKGINTAAENNASAEAIAAAQGTLRDLADILGLRLQEKEGDAGAGQFIDLLLEIRADLRAAKQFALADKIRDELTARGVVVNDGKDGATWSWE